MEVDVAGYVKKVLEPRSNGWHCKTRSPVRSANIPCEATCLSVVEEPAAALGELSSLSFVSSFHPIS